MEEHIFSYDGRDAVFVKNTADRQNYLAFVCLIIVTDIRHDTIPHTRSAPASTPISDQHHMGVVRGPYIGLIALLCP